MALLIFDLRLCLFGIQVGPYLLFVLLAYGMESSILYQQNK